MKRFSTLLSRKGSPGNAPDRTFSIANLENAPADSPEGTASRAVRLFCESGSANNRDEEVLHLPTIVDAAESSPAAAAACAVQIRSFMQKQYAAKPHVQYNAIMLIRILADNPGASFTRNFDDKFVKTSKHLLRDCRDQNVQQLLRETLDSLEANRSGDAGVQPLVQMWRREKGSGQRLGGHRQADTRIPYGGALVGGPPMLDHNHAHSASRSATQGQLPAPVELASRIEESRNTAKILIQFLQTTPAEELGTNELIREFADRCQSAQRSMQSFINCENPAPDDDTLQTLIEANEQLSLANSRYQRAVLAARRALCANPSPGAEGRSASTAQGSVTTDDRILASVAEAPQTNSFGTFSNYGQSNTYSSQQSYPSPVSPPVQHIQPNLSTPPQTRVQQDDHYDDLYDSPRVTRADNPFSDPVDHHRISPPLTSATFDSTRHDNVYAASPPRSNASISPALTQARPGPGAWHNSTITPSFLGRQESAANGITMHAPGAASELDSHSNVGRTDYTRPAQQTSFTVTHETPALQSGGIDRSRG